MFNLNSRQMYKVFLNECPLRLSAKTQNSSLGNICKVIEIQELDGLFDFLLTIDCLKYAEEPVSVVFNTEELLLATIKSFHQLPAAGGLLRRGDGRILFIHRLKKWDLPKGKIEDGESIEDAAIREVEEECGISGVKILKPLPSTYHIYRSPWLPADDNWVWKETRWFEMYYDGNETPVPQTEEDITEIRWFGVDELNEVLANTYGNISSLIRNYLD